MTCELCGRDGDAPCQCQQNSLLGFLSDFRAGAAPVSPPASEGHRVEAMTSSVVEPPAPYERYAPPVPSAPPPQPLPPLSGDVKPPAPPPAAYPPPTWPASQAIPTYERPAAYPPAAYPPPAAYQSGAYEPPAAYGPPGAYPPPGAYGPPGAYPPPTWSPSGPVPAYGAPAPGYGAQAQRPSFGRRLVSGRTPIAILAALAAVLVTLAVVLPKASSAPSLQGKSPAAILQTSLLAASKAGSAHIVIQVAQGGHSETDTGDISPTGGILNSTTDGYTATMKEIGQTDYLKADAGYYEAADGASAAVASRLGGMWLSMPASGNNDFTQTGQMLDSSTIINDLLTVTGPISKVSSSQDNLILTGTVPNNSFNQGTGAGDLAHLVISSRSPFRPISIAFSDPQNGSLQLTFSNWGESVPLVPPASAVPLSSLVTQDPAAAARAAQENVRNALTAEETYYTSNQEFDTTASPNGVQALEPSLQFTATGPVTPGIKVLVRPDHDSVVLTAAGSDGNCYTIEAQPASIYYYVAPGSGSGDTTKCSAPPKLVDSLPAAPTGRSASASPGTWSLAF